MCSDLIVIWGAYHSRLECFSHTRMEILNTFRISFWIYMFAFVIGSFLILTLFIDTCSAQLLETERQYYACYGSHSGKVFLDADCPLAQVIAIKEIYVGSKKNFLGCPQETASPFNEAMEMLCCSPDESNDCITPYGVKTNFHPGCTGHTTCPELPVINATTSCDTGTYMAFSNYMYLDYYCIPGECTWISHSYIGGNIIRILYRTT